MSTTDFDIVRAPADRTPAPHGPVTAARQRRTMVIYGLVCLLGLLPVLLQMSPAWQAAGLGLWLPGAGFLTVGGWSITLFPLTLLVFVISLVAWFWAGAIIAPIIVWGGSAFLAAGMATETAWPAAHGVAALLIVAGGLFVRAKTSARHADGARVFAERLAHLPQSITDVEEEAAQVPDPTTREMTPEQLAALRYVLDRALQPMEEFNGFDIIDQFQPAALRYQLNHMGFALGIAQGSYVPNFQGYMGQAQRNLIEKYLQKRVWDYWVLESCWGHFNFTNFDPADKDNIMLTGWYGSQVGQYMLNSGDRRYGEKGSLTFRLNKKTAYEHDLHTMTDSITRNLDGSEFCLFPCEPNWIYPMCNHYGMTALASHDAVFGTTKSKDRLATWMKALDTEFTNTQGSVIGLRSQLLGFEVPFPVDEATYSKFENCFAPERARRQWAIARNDYQKCLVVDESGVERLTLPGPGLDAGNYKLSFAFAYSSVLVAAREFGDDRIATAAERSLELDCGGAEVDGVYRVPGGSNISNADVVSGKLMRTGDFRRSFVEGPPKYVFEGPVLSDATYPDVLVARAFSDGTNLDLVLYPGQADGNGTAHILGLGRLKPGHSYAVEGAEPAHLEVGEDGAASIEVTLSDRTPVNITLETV